MTSSMTSLPSRISSTNILGPGSPHSQQGQRHLQQRLIGCYRLRAKSIKLYALARRTAGACHKQLYFCKSQIAPPHVRARQGACCATQGAASNQPQPSFADVMNSIFAALAAQQDPGRPEGAHLCVEGLHFQPPGAPDPLLRGVTLSVEPNTLGLIFGRSGSGKTTLLQTIAGLAEPSSGSISFSGPLLPGSAATASATNGAPIRPGGGLGGGLPSERRMAAAGLVFQFPERHFLGTTLGEELTVGWPSGMQWMGERQALSARAYQVLNVVGLSGLPIDVPLASLSDGYKRRVALAVQLVRRPSLLLLDEPLAGLDWQTRGELLSLLSSLKSECTILVVSHDLRELAPLVDSAWCMEPGGKLKRCSAGDVPLEW